MKNWKQIQDLNCLPSTPPAAAKSAKAASSTEAATTKAITTTESATAKTVPPAKSSTTTVTPEAAAVTALEILEPLTRKIASRSVLSLAIQVFRPTSTIGSVKVAAGMFRTAFSGAIGAARSRGCSLLIGFASRLLLIILCALPVRLGFVHGIPTAVVVLLPTVASVLVNIAIVFGIHVAAGSFSGCRVSPCGIRPNGFTARGG
jgi:hypothetical protein